MFNISQIVLCSITDILIILLYNHITKLPNFLNLVLSPLCPVRVVGGCQKSNSINRFHLILS